MNKVEKATNELADLALAPLRDDGEFTISRVIGTAGQLPRLLISPILEQPSRSSVARLEHAFVLRHELDPAWAARPVDLVKAGSRLGLVIEDPGGQFLDELMAAPRAIPDLLHLGIGMATALSGLHARGLVHKDVKPANFIVQPATGGAWLRNFGLTSRLSRHRQSPEPPEVIAGTLAYMAPEQTGRMNRSIDSRSDLYSLGVVFYEMFVGELPFTAGDPMEWVHCHIAKQPVAPRLRRNAIPEPLSAIILKLLSKSPEERYQTATGVAADLRHCLTALERQGWIEPFALGAGDVADRLLVPEKLYGREKETGLLLATFDRVIHLGTTELVLVSGYSGVGKSSLVNELHKVLVPPRGLFASGKFDQYKRDIPYATLAQAFRTLVRQLLGKSDAEVAHWRAALAEALGPNGRLIVNLIPEIELIIGQPPPVPDLPLQEARNRFQRVLRRFIGAFARAEHPLALFLDDLQWLDAATLELIESLITDPEVGHLLLVGAYRDNEVGPGHPLRRTLQEIREAGARVQPIVLAPLGNDDLAAFVADTLHCSREHSRPLAQLVHEKTGGNPFFATQFIAALAEENLIAFDPAAAMWTWDLPRILAKGYTDNVVELMVAKLNRLPEAAQNSLKHLACVGNSAGTAILQLVYGDTEQALGSALWEPIRLGLVSRSGEIYSFTHDRIQEAAYALVPVAERAEAHLKIGKALASQIALANLEENIFEIVNHLNRGSALLRSSPERVALAELNLMAGKRAKATSAFAAAVSYFATGRELLPERADEQHHTLRFALSLQQAECEYMTGELAAAEERLAVLFEQAGSIAERAAATCLSVDLHTNLDQADRAVAVGLEYLRRVGIQWSPHPTDRDVEQEYERLWQRLGNRSIEELIDLPPLTAPEDSATLDVLTSVHAPANFIDGNLLAQTIGRMVSLSLEHGNGDASPFAYVYVGMIMGSRFGNYRDGFRFGKLGVDLLERSGRERFKARVLCNFGNSVNPWARHIRTSCEVLRAACESAQEAGDFTFLAYSFTNLISAMLGAGDNLSDVQRKAESGLALVQQARFSTAVDMFLGQLGLIRALRGQTAHVSTFNGPGFEESTFEPHLAADPGLAMPACWYWIRKLQAYVFAGDYQAARAAASKAQALLWTSPSFFVTAEYHFYAALAWASEYDQAPAGERSKHLAALSSHRERLEKWAEGCPENFANRAALLAAELARIEDRPLEAMPLYEHAIQSARENGFVQNEGLANELAARFYARRGFETIADAYLRNARYCYLRWGADGKVRQLDQLHPRWREQPRSPAATSTIRTNLEHLDLAAIVKTSQTVSGEIVLGKLIERLMKIAVEHMGAERGLLILFPDAAPQIEAEATTVRTSVAVNIRRRAVSPSELPQSILNYVIRTQQSVVLDDASTRNIYSEDEYIQRARPRSVLCLPIVKQTQLVGAFYLENKLTPCAFPSDRVAILELLSSQAAISIENARLYAALEQENLDRQRVEEELRRSEAYLAEGQKLSATGSFGWSVAADEHFWSDETYRIFGYDVCQQVTLQMVRDRIHPEDIPLLDDVVARAAHGESFDYECRLLLPSGVVKRVHIVAHAVRDEFGTHEFVGAVMDITATRQAEAAMRQAQTELAHVTRATTMGELAASIAHEINQPISGVVLNGNACLRWLAGMKEESANLAEARETLRRIIRDGNRAGEVITRIRALFKKAPSAKEPLDLNETIREIIVLVRNEMDRQRVTLRLELPPDLPSVFGDPVQLQQVMLNLILNAIDAMATIQDRARDLVIRTLSTDGQVQVTVRDSGIGLQPGTIENIFTAFYTTKPRGLGMGLSISRSIVENHAGQLWVTAEDGPGASFHFTLPIASRMEA